MAGKCQGIPVPEMYIDNENSEDRKQRYLRNQWKIMEPLFSNKLQGPYLFYTVSDLETMFLYFENSDNIGVVSALRLYFAIYNEAFTFIFAPIGSDGTDLNKYYLIPPGGPFNPEACLLDLQTASDCVTDWQNNWLPKFPQRTMGTE